MSMSSLVAQSSFFFGEIARKIRSLDGEQREAGWGLDADTLILFFQPHVMKKQQCCCP